MAQDQNRYQEMTVQYLKRNNPKELKMLTAEDELTEFLTDIQEMFVDQETEIFQQMTKDLPEKFEQRAQMTNQASQVSREVATTALTEFLASL
ncbi:MAG: TnpV protein [Desulfoprunum sp.]|nr:TnpV protein [Desulfoprunum sp.]